MRVKPRHTNIVNKTDIPQPGESFGMPVKSYVHGATGAHRPAPDDTYKVDGTEHRFDGRCHDDCENVR